MKKAKAPQCRNNCVCTCACWHVCIFLSSTCHLFVSTSAFLTVLPVQNLAGPNVQSMLATSDKTKRKKGSKTKIYSLTLYYVPLMVIHGKRIDANVARLRLTMKILKTLYLLYVT